MAIIPLVKADLFPLIAELDARQRTGRTRSRTLPAREIQPSNLRIDKSRVHAILESRPLDQFLLPHPEHADSSCRHLCRPWRAG
jgi:hypothetical protein